MLTSWVNIFEMGEDTDVHVAVHKKDQKKCCDVVDQYGLVLSYFFRTGRAFGLFSGAPGIR